jgi:hypothetical protein
VFSTRHGIIFIILILVPTHGLCFLPICEIMLQIGYGRKVPYNLLRSFFSTLISVGLAHLTLSFPHPCSYKWTRRSLCMCGVLYKTNQEGTWSLLTHRYYGAKVPLGKNWWYKKQMLLKYLVRRSIPQSTSITNASLIFSYIWLGNMVIDQIPMVGLYVCVHIFFFD